MSQPLALQSKPWPSIVLWLLIVAGMFVHLQAALQFNPLNAIFSDPGRHWQFGLNPLLADPLSGMDAPLYQLWLSLIAKLTLGDMRAIGIYAGLLSVLTTWVWYRLMREVLPSRWLARLGWAVFLWLPSWIGIFSYFMPETLLLPTLGLALWFTFRSLRVKTMESFVWCVVFWMVASLARPFALPLAILSLWALLLVHEQPAKKALVAAVIAICACVPPAYRTYQILRVWSPFGYTMMNQIYFESGKREVKILLSKNHGSVGWVYGFASPSMGMRPLHPLSLWTSSREGTVHIAVNIDQGNRDWLVSLRENWGGLLLHMKMGWENTVYTTFGESWPDNNPRHFWEWLSVQLRWVWAPILVSVVAGNVAYLIHQKKAPLFLVLTMTAIVACYFVPATPTEGRYRKQIEGFMIVNALWLVSRNTQERTRRATESPHV